VDACGGTGRSSTALGTRNGGTAIGGNVGGACRNVMKIVGGGVGGRRVETPARARERTAAATAAWNTALTAIPTADRPP
jgi:hypothetical protein